MESLVKVWQAVHPLAQALRRLMPPNVAKVAGSKNPAFGNMHHRLEVARPASADGVHLRPQAGWPSGGAKLV